MSSDDSDAEPHLKRKRKICQLEDNPAESTSSSGSPIIGSSSRQRRYYRDKNPVGDTSDSESDSGSSIHRNVSRRKKVRRMPIDSDSESSGSSIFKRTKRTSRIASDSDTEVSDRGFEGSSSSQWETDFSDTDVDQKVKPEPAVSSAVQNNGIDSDSSDGQSEKCPICLLSFKTQEIGTPESCDHMFCLECIQEWSKNMNTCPVDRQTYNLILVRKDMNGRVVRQVPIETPAPQNDVDIVEDPTYCEICGSSDNEDQMLLCDGCDLGFHLYCLTPPLDEVPGGTWYCNACSIDELGDDDLFDMLDEVITMSQPEVHGRRRRNLSARLVPRTRQTERVRRRIANNRQQNSQLDRPSTSSSLEDSQLVNSVSSTTTRAKRSSKPKKSRRRTRRTMKYKTVYEIDKLTGETVPVKKCKPKSRKTKKKRARAERSKPKTVKKRLASQLGICAPKTTPQSLPDVKIQGATTLGGLRHQAGIPTLHLFGPSNELDYFSGEEDDSYIGGSAGSLLTARAPNRSDISAMRRVARRKAAISFPSTVSSSTDLLGSILDSQAQLHSRNSAYSVDSTGRFVIEQKKKSQSEYIDVNKQSVSARERPNRGHNYPYRQSNNNPNYNRSNPNSYHSYSHYQYHSTPSSTMGSTSGSGYGGGGDANETPQDYTQRTLCASSEVNTQDRRDNGEDNTGTNTPNSESEIDIYSDIETVSTSKLDDFDFPPPPTPPILRDVFTPDDDNDSEPDMVIDDDKVPEFDRNDEDQKEETAVTSTVGFSGEFAPNPMDFAPEMPHSSTEIQSGAVQSSDQMDNRNMEDDEDWTDGCPNTSIYSRESIDALKETEDGDLDDGCPNFSIYSKESKSLALHTDISMSGEDNMQQQQDYQVGEVSSSPNVGVQDNFAPQNNEMQHVGLSLGEAVSSTPNLDVPPREDAYDPHNPTQDEDVDQYDPNVPSQDDDEYDPNIPTQENDQLDPDIPPQENDHGPDVPPQEIDGHEPDIPHQENDGSDPDVLPQENDECDPDIPPQENEVCPQDPGVLPQENDGYDPTVPSLENDDHDADIHSEVGDEYQPDIPPREDEYDPNIPFRDDDEYDSHSPVFEDGDEYDPNIPPLEYLPDSPSEDENDDAAASDNTPQDDNESYNIEKDFSVQPETPEEENVTYDFERNTGIPATENEGENVIYDFEKFDKDKGGDQAGTSTTTKPKVKRRPQVEVFNELSNPPNPRLSRKGKVEIVKKLVSGGILGGLYSDSEDESVVKKHDSSFAFSDINHMTEDISEEERSYTPCLDEKGNKQGLEGLDTEMISDEERNDFDESHELKTAEDGDALEINAKESELDFTRPEDYEEGEIVDKNKAAKKTEEVEKKKAKPKTSTEEENKTPKKPKRKEKPAGEQEKGGNKENEGHNKEASFKKLSKNTKERNYRDKDMTRQAVPSRDRSQNKRERKREKRKELERYNVRAIISEKPRPLIIKDQFGRDVRRTPSRSKSRSATPPVQRSPSKITSPSKIRRSVSRHRSLSPRISRSLSRHGSLSRPTRQSPSKDRTRKRRARSRQRSMSRSRSRSLRKRRAGSKNKKRKRSSSRQKRRKSRDISKGKKKPRNRSRHRSMSPSRRNNREWINMRGWTPVSASPPMEVHHQMSPSWTPPRVMDTSHLLNDGNLTVTLNNQKKKKDKRRKGEKRTKENALFRPRRRRRERERTPPPSKEVFASGDNILVSVSFNNDNEIRDVTTREKRRKELEERKKKERRKNKNRKDLSGIKPVAIIDLERSPFKELTPSPRAVIVLSDSDNNDNEEVSRSEQNNICDSSQQVASPERNVNYSTGPKTPPEPQIKFSLSAKPPQLRAINNPLHDPDDMENNEDDVQEEMSSRVNESSHKGPNTPPEPPNSPPSSPDVYDPFEPTKSRSPTPDPLQGIPLNIGKGESLESRAALELLEKSINPPNPELKSLTPPIADIQPADSQSSIQATPDSNAGKSPERTNVVANQTVQPSLSTSKPVGQTTPFSSVPTSLVTSTPISSSLAPPRVSILNSTIITPPHVVSSVPQRIILPNQVKSSPVKISPTKATIKSTPIKPMPNKNSKSITTRKSWTQNGSGVEDITLDFDSPYSPGSSDYEDLFEPPPDNVKSTTKSANKSNAKSPQKHQSIFDTLFGSPSFNKSKNRLDRNRFGKKSVTPSKTKTVGVKLDEDNLKILDELPNSAVEMLVKDKFLKKLNRQERVVEEVKLVLKPHYNKKRVNKEEYKEIMRRAVPKICHNKSGEINPTKIKNLIEAYVRKVRHSKKVTSSSSVNPQKV